MTSPPPAGQAPTAYATFIRRPASTRFVLLVTGAACPSEDEIAAQVEEGQHVAAVVRAYHGDLPIPKRVSSWRTDPGRTELAIPIVGTRRRAVQ
jgi:hypothetical protein